MRYITDLITAITHALRGIKSGFLSERNMKIHLLGFIFMMGSAWFFGFNYMEWALCLVLSVMVFVVELFNTAIEFLSDTISPELHPYIKIAKDCAAGGVLLTSVLAVVVWGLILINKFI